MTSTAPGKTTIRLADGHETTAEVMAASGYDAVQEQKVTVAGVIKRLNPCAFHAQSATGETRYGDDGRAVANPNGYHHECAECAQMTSYEDLEGVD